MSPDQLHPEKMIVTPEQLIMRHVNITDFASASKSTSNHELSRPYYMVKKQQACLEKNQI